ncbi:WD40 repeat-like protein [Trametopsis cervina]|nr:WD40 repeat-like protein [Trametopsis cervina]
MASTAGGSSIRNITISDIQCDNLPGRAHRYFVSILAAGDVNSTAVANRTKGPKWTERFTYAVPSSSIITLTVLRHRGIFGNKVIGSAQIGVDSRLDGGIGQEATLQLIMPGNPGGRVEFVPEARIQCKITAHATTEAVDQVTSHANSNVDNLSAAPVLMQKMFGDTEGTGTVANTIQEDVIAWEPVIDSIKVFSTLVKDIAQIHPYAHAAMTVISLIPKVINDQLKTDQRLRDLVSAMQRAYGFVKKAAPLNDIQLHIEFFAQMARATFECGNFIQEYVNSGSFVARAIKGVVSSKAKTQLEKHTQSLASLIGQFKEDGAINTEISVVRTLSATESIAEAVDELTMKSYLDDMRYANGAGCIPEKKCLEGTRVRLLDSISGHLHGGGIHAEGQGSGRILLLTGVAGSGKSAVAHEIAHRFKSLRRLGASFCFSASHQTERSVDRFLSTISRGFAELDHGWKNSLVAIIKSDKELRTTRSPRQQLEEFILKPAQRLQFVGPIVVVVDALDEAAYDEQASLLDCLSRLATDTSLPHNIRFLITSRPEPAIINALYGKARIEHLDILSADAKDDIHRFIEHKLTTAGLGVGTETIRNEWVPYLAATADNSFQWAYTSCEFIKGDILGSSPEERFRMLRRLEYRGLDSLYEEVMRNTITVSNKLKTAAFEKELQEKVRRVLGLMITVYEPLPWRTWMDLFGEDNEDMKITKSVIPHLAPLFRGVSAADRDKNYPIQPSHTSLRDYLTRDTPVHLFRADTTTAHVKLFDACLRTMEAQLRFNICDLETSYRANKDVLDLAERIQHNVSPALLYACRFWNSHLTAPPHEQVSLDLLFGFLETKLLFWIEVISLVRTAVSASVGIKEIRKWIQTSKSDAEERLRQLDKILDEVDQFLSMCIPAISLSTPHLYLSALAYVPATSFINRYYSDIYTGGVRILNKDELRWPECVMRIATGSPINDVAISPDGRILATAHFYYTIGLWSPVTGESVGEPLVGHTGPVREVAFSPDSTTIASGSDDNTVRLWNVATGEQIWTWGAPWGHADSAWSVAFSPDGQRLVSGSYDGKVGLWDVSSREPACEALVGHTSRVESVAFSPCGKTFASGSLDETVCVWNAETRALLYAPLRGHKDAVWSVAFSPDGQTLASGAGDGMIRLWDVATGQPKAPPLAGHTSSVYSVAFSPDGRTLASGSGDKTIRLWIVESGRPVGDPLKGHTGSLDSVAFGSDAQTLVSCASDSTVCVWKIDHGRAGHARIAAHSRSVYGVAFSPDNRIAASASSDGAVRLWDVCTGQPAGEPLRGHTDKVKSVVFSPDGRTIASGSDDRTIRLWNAQTGQLLREPLTGHSDDVNSVAFSHDSKILASGSDDETIRLWSAVTGEQLGEPLAGHTHFVTSVVFSPDGRCLASGSVDDTIMLWDVTTRQPIGELPRRHKYSVKGATFSSDGKTIASGWGPGTIGLWRVNTCELIGAPLEGHDDYVESVAFSPDGKTLVSGSRDHTIRLWNVATHAPIGGPLRGHTSSVSSVAFSPDGTSILSGSDDHTVRLWSVPFAHSPLPTYPSSYGVSLALPPSLKSRDASPNEPTHTITTTTTGSVIDALRANESLSGPSATSQHILNTDSSDPDDNGYMLGPEGQLLFWVPPDYRTGLYRTSTRWVAGARSVHLDLSHFTHGEHWIHCRAGDASQ